MKSKINSWIEGTEAGTLSVCITYSTGRNVALSLKAAEHIAKDTDLGNVLYLNTVQTSRQLGASIRKYANAEFSSETEDSRIIYESSASGLLLDDAEELERYLASEQVQYIIINCWEMASKDYRRKSDLIFLLNRWMHEYGATIIVFAEAMNSSPETGKIHRGIGIGKLALIASQIRVFKKKDKVQTADDAKESAQKLEERKKKYEEYVRTPIPVWMPKTASEERAVLAEYRVRHIPIDPYFGEFPEAFRKRMLGNIGKDMLYRPEDYHRWLGDADFRIEEAPEEYFYTELPEGEEIKPQLVWSKDRLPMPSKYHVMNSDEITEADTEDLNANEEEKPLARAKLL